MFSQFKDLGCIAEKREDEVVLSNQRAVMGPAEKSEVEHSHPFLPLGPACSSLPVPWLVRTVTYIGDGF